MRKLGGLITILFMCILLSSLPVHAEGIEDIYSVGDIIEYQDDNGNIQYLQIVAIIIPNEEYSVIPIEINKNKINVTDHERDLLAWIVCNEAEGEDFLGKRLIVDTILNRVNDSYFPNSIESVIYEPYQFWTVQRNDIPQSCYEAVDYELKNGITDPNITFFNSEYYTIGQNDLYKHGGHYFSSLKR